MGFDVSALEVLLETDFEKFKEKRFELMRHQIRGPRPPAPEGAARPFATAGTPEAESHPPVPPAAAPVPRPSGLHSRFMGSPLFAGPPPAGPAGPPQHERIHSEMRYPAARRRAPEKKVRTFSVETEPERDAGVIVVGETGPVQKGTRPPSLKMPLKKARKARPPEPKAREGSAGGEGPAEIAVEDAERADAEEEPEMAVEEEGPETREEPAHQPEEEESEVAVEEESEEPAPPEERAGGEGQGPEGEAGEGEVPEGGDEEEREPVSEGSEEREPEGEGERERVSEGEEEEEEKPGLVAFPSRVPMKVRAVEGRRQAPGEKIAGGGKRGRMEDGKRKGMEGDAEMDGGGEEEEAPAPTSPVLARKRPPGKAAVKVRKAAKKGTPRPSYGWAVIVVLLLVILAVAGWWFLANPMAGPTARASFPRTVAAGETVQFDGSNSSPGAGSIEKYEWKFGDGSSAAGKRTTHFFTAVGNFTVQLTVVNGDGASSAPYRSRILVTPLSFTVPPGHIGDRASYGVTGEGYVSNNDTDLYSYNLPGAEIHVTAVDLELSGELDQWVRDNVTAEDGFGAEHNALRTMSEEHLSLAGSNVTTNLGTYRVSSGSLNYTEYSFADPSTSAVFKVDSRASTSLTLQVGISGRNSIVSTDSLRSYPSVAAMPAQFHPELIYKGRSFDQAGGNQSGSYRSGNVTYSWTSGGIKNIDGFASLGLRITADQAFLDRLGLSEFYMELWVSGYCSLPTGSHVHVAGRSGEDSFHSDYYTVMSSFSAGTVDIVSIPQTFDPEPLSRDLFSDSFSDVPETGNGSTGLLFSPEEAQQAALTKDDTFSHFLSNYPQAYAVAAKYFEGLYGPGTATWNLTFGWPGASTAYYVNVTLTRDPLDKYNVHGDYLSKPPSVTTAEAALSDSGTLTLSSAEARLRDNDTETYQTFFSNGSVQWAAGVSMSLQADALYPNINIASMTASGERAGYAMLLQKDGYTSALSMDTGQFMYYYTHSAQ